MIKNERQYRITKAQAQEFERGLKEMREAPADDKQLDPIIRQAMEDAMASQLSTLHRELGEYEALRSGECTVLDLASLDELPSALIRARIASGLSQKQLAERLGLKEQQIQRYEATEYAAANLERLQEISQALGIQVMEMSFYLAPMTR
jgi:DNA-binding Xre family transcriptional regulator